MVRRGERHLGSYDKSERGKTVSEAAVFLLSPFIGVAAMHPTVTTLSQTQ
jgi:hypothetical protein